MRQPGDPSGGEPAAEGGTTTAGLGDDAAEVVPPDLWHETTAVPGAAVEEDGDENEPEKDPADTSDSDASSHPVEQREELEARLCLELDAAKRCVDHRHDGFNADETRALEELEQAENAGDRGTEEESCWCLAAQQTVFSESGFPLRHACGHGGQGAAMQA